MKRILVIGCPGAGKSTFSRKLRDALGLPLFYLDMLWHKPDRSNISQEEFDARLKEILSGDEWIIDGNYIRTLDARLRCCDAVFLLDYPVSVCLKGAAERVGREREDMPWIENQLDAEFKDWITAFPKDQLPRIYALLNSNADKEITVFKSRKQAAEYLSGLKNRE